jgi:tRNA nucleotidyltransferase (CCA-adding enzyme)
VIDPKLIPDDVLAVCRRLRDAGHQAHLVGGGIRDLLLGRPPADFDVATSALPDQTLALFGHRYAIPTGLQHGTITVLAGTAEKTRHVEVTTFRGEGEYLDGRRPSSVNFSATLEEDLSRRDFTMNAIAYDPLAARVTDPFAGQADLAAKTVRAVGDPLQRFREDGLRPMRAVRQATQLGFTIDPPTQQAIPATLDVFRKVSAERIRDELWKMLAADKPARGLELMRETGLLGATIPELLEGVGVTQNRYHRFDVYGHTLATLDGTQGNVTVRFGALLHDVGKPRARLPKEGAPGEYSFFRHEFVGAEMATDICRRLKLSTEEREDVTALVAHHMFFYQSDWSDGTVRRFVRRVGQERLPALMALRAGDIAGRGFGEDPQAETRELEARIAQVAADDAALDVTDLAVNGRDIMQVLGIPPSRKVGQILERLLERVLDDPALNTREGLEALLPEALRSLEPAAK